MRSLLLALLFALRTLAIFADEAGLVDWHYALLGLPHDRSTIFHQPYPDSKASLLYTLSERNVVGAVNPKDGNLVWRHDLQKPGIGRGQMSTADAQDIIVTAVGDAVNVWAAADGRLVWERRFAQSRAVDVALAGREHAQQSNETYIVYPLIAASTFKIYRFETEKDEIIWEYEDDSTDIPYRVVPAGPDLFYLSLSKSMLKGQKLKVTTLDQLTGKQRNQVVLNSESEINSIDDILFVSSDTTAPFIVWSTPGRDTLKANILGSKSIATLDIPNAVENPTNIRVSSASSQGGNQDILIEFQSSGSHSATLYSLNKGKGALTTTLVFPSLSGYGSFSISRSQEKSYFVRVTQKDIQLYGPESSDPLKKWSFMEEVVTADHNDAILPLHSTSEVVARAPNTYAVRSAIMCKSGNWILLRNGEVTWARPEFLADITRFEWAELGLDQSRSEGVEAELLSNSLASFVLRAQRHLSQLQTGVAGLSELPHSVMAWAKSFVSGSDREASRLERLSFNKLALVVTSSGRLAALDFAKSGRIVANIEMDLSTETLESTPLWKVISDETSLNARPSSGHYQPYSSELVYDLKDGQLQGRKDESNLWQFNPQPGHSIRSLSSISTQEPVASIGKGLSDRRVLYKYLNPNAILVVTQEESTSSFTIYVLDALSGNLLHSATQENIDLSQPITSLISENWFCYSFTQYGAGNDGLSRGSQLVVAEMYESELPNDRGPLEKLANFSSVAPSISNTFPNLPHVISLSFQIPEVIDHMAVSQTAQGVTSRQLIVSVPAINSIVGLPRQLLDARRPVGKDPTKPQQFEEGLIRYAPAIEFDPKWHLNHKQEIYGIKDIETSPSNLESTSLVLAYGLDLFGTRITPSFAFDVLSDNFNKLQLVLTVGGLLIGVFVVGPLVQRKTTNMLWYAVS